MAADRRPRSARGTSLVIVYESPPARSKARPSQPYPLCSSGSVFAVCQMAIDSKCDRFGFG
jgi:hypothetical protein